MPNEYVTRLLNTDGIFENIIHWSLYLVVLTFILNAVRNWIKLRNIYKKIPSSKLSFYSILGHNGSVIRYFFRKRRIPLSAYVSIVLNGYTKVYGKKGIALMWNLMHPSIIIYGAEPAELILSHSTELQKGWMYRFLHPWLGDGLLTSEGSKWKTRRRQLTPAFHFSILRDFLPVMNKQAKVFVDVLRPHLGKEPVDVVPLITHCTFDIICESVLGAEMNSQTKVDCDYLKSVIELTHMVIDRSIIPWLYPNFIFSISSMGRKFKYHQKRVHAVAYELIAKMKKELSEAKELQKDSHHDLQNQEQLGSRKKRPLLELLMEEHLMNNSITEDEIREEVDTFMFEGHDTTASGMIWSMYLIGLYPDVQSKIHDELDSIFGKDTRDPTMDDVREMKYLEYAIKESLRLYPPVPGYARTLQEDLKYKDLVFPKGSTCFLWISALHRDPELFPKPEIYDPERFAPENSIGRHSFAYVPFSAGPRNCIGQRFAMMEEKVVLSTILRNYKIKSVDPRDKILEIMQIVTRPSKEIKILISSRS